MHCISRYFNTIYLGKVKWEVQGEAVESFILDWILQQGQQSHSWERLITEGK